MIEFMTDPQLRRLQLIELDILKAFIKVCDDHNLRYFLCGGTLLGAIRHKGFIPWDDDIDVEMPRGDYMRFLNLSPNLLGDAYDVISMYNNKDCIYTFAKVVDKRTKLKEPVGKEIGVYIDIFPIDGLPDNIKESDKHFKKMSNYNRILSYSILEYKKGRTPIRTIIKYSVIFICKLLGENRLLNLIDKTARKYDFEKSKYIAVSVVSYYGNRERIGKEAYQSSIKVQFEDLMFNAPIGYHQYLSNIYDDYMKLPSVEKRVTHHSHIVSFI